MKILLLSDTHGYVDDQILEYAKEADEVWHGGDIGDLSVADSLGKLRPLRAVSGNIDGKGVRDQFPEELIFEIEGLRVFIIHIGGYPGRYVKGVKNRLKEVQPHLFISGHSHILKVMPDKQLNLLHMNPGAVGHHGFHTMRTMIRFEIVKGRIVKPEVIELGKRGKIETNKALPT